MEPNPDENLAFQRTSLTAGNTERNLEHTHAAWSIFRRFLSKMEFTFTNDLKRSFFPCCIIMYHAIGEIITMEGIRKVNPQSQVIALDVYPLRLEPVKTLQKEGKIKH